MAGQGKKWLIGCGVGCVVTMLVGVLLLVGGGFLMMRPFNEAVEHQTELVDLYGQREDFIPLPDGLTPDRLEAFLGVREEMMVHCQTFEDIAASFQDMDKLDQQGDDPPVGEILKGVGNVMGSAMSMAGEIGALIASRNNELLKNKMGLGEYVWIYVLAYNSWLGFTPNTEYQGDSSEGFSERESRFIKQLMLNHARALEEVDRHQEANLWRDEAGRLNRSEGRVPFSSGSLPPEVTSALVPYRIRLEASYCAAMAQFDLGNVKKKGFSIQSY
nr:hypothetical protein [Candidatus Krumholzibacteria bacterium]